MIRTNGSIVPSLAEPGKVLALVVTAPDWIAPDAVLHTDAIGTAEDTVPTVVSSIRSLLGSSVRG